MDEQPSDAAALDDGRWNNPLRADCFAAPGPLSTQEDAWIIRFNDPDCREAVFTGPDAEEQARQHWNRYSPAFNMYVFRLARLPAPSKPNPGN